MPILLHGDAAFPGQGIVAETLNLSGLPGYAVSGTIHIIVNNQIGFTTDIGDSRSTLYAGDLAKGFEIPVVHVNADDPEACLTAANLAMAYRQRFGKDFLIDLVGYRRWGPQRGRRADLHPAPDVRRHHHAPDRPPALGRPLGRRGRRGGGRAGEDAGHGARRTGRHPEVPGGGADERPRPGAPAG
jgi:2-oxoglutarate dehydrogenase E1 component